MDLKHNAEWKKPDPKDMFCKVLFITEQKRSNLTSSIRSQVTHDFIGEGLETGEDLPACS